MRGGCFDQRNITQSPEKRSGAGTKKGAEKKESVAAWGGKASKYLKVFPEKSAVKKKTRQSEARDGSLNKGWNI